MYKYVTAMLGALYVMKTGELVTVTLSVISWGYNHMVSKSEIRLVYFMCIYPTGSQYYSNNYFDLTDNPSFTYGTFLCSGSEQSLADCPRHSVSSILNCYSNEIAGVRCIGQHKTVCMSLTQLQRCLH